MLPRIDEGGHSHPEIRKHYGKLDVVQQFLERIVHPTCEVFCSPKYVLNYDLLGFYFKSCLFQIQPSKTQSEGILRQVDAWHGNGNAIST